MAGRAFISNVLGIDGTPESGALINSFVLGTSTRSPLYSTIDVSLGTGTPTTNPYVCDSLGQAVFYFDTAISYEWRATTSNGAVTLWEAEVVGGILTLTFTHPDYTVFPIIDLSAVRSVPTYAALTALTSANGLIDGAVFCTKARATADDGGYGFWRYDAGSTATADSGTVLAINGGGAGRFFRQYVGPIRYEWFSSLTTALTAASTGWLIISTSVAVATNTTIAASLKFENGGKLVPAASVVLTLTGAIDADESALIFDLAASSSRIALSGPNKDVEVAWFGGTVADVGIGVQRAMTAVARRINLFRQSMNWTTAVTVPQAWSGQIVWFGDTIFVAASLTAINFLRTDTVEGSNLSLFSNNGWVVESGLGATSKLADWRGFATGTAPSETVVYNNNYLSIDMGTGQIWGFDRGIYSKYSRVLVDNVRTQYNNIFWESGRDSSFCRVWRYLGVGNKQDIHYDDATANGLSNGIHLNEFYSVLAASGSNAPLYIKGVQGVTGQGNSIDLATSGDYCAHFIQCDDLDLKFVWMASDLVAEAGHEAFCIHNTYRARLDVGSFTNHEVIGRITADGSYVDDNCGHSILFGSSLGITNTGFVFVDVAGVWVQGAAMLDALPRASTNYEFVSVSADYIVVEVKFIKGASYVFPSIGANSSIATPKWLP